MKSALTLLLLSTPLLAAEPSWLAGNHLTGDWKGLRTDLEESGVKYFGFYNAIFAANVSGGRDQDSNFAGDFFTGIEFDLEKIAGWDDTTFTVTAIDRHGSSIDREVGGQYSVMQLVGGQNTFLYNVTLGRDELLKRIACPKLPKKLPVVLSPDEVVRFLQAVPGLKHRALLMTAYSAGLRISEVVALRVEDIDSRRFAARSARGLAHWPERQFGGRVVHRKLKDRIVVVAVAGDGGAPMREGVGFEVFADQFVFLVDYGAEAFRFK